MGNVVNLMDRKDDDNFKHCSYIDFEGDIGVSTMDRSMIVMPLNLNDIEVNLNGQSAVYNREELSEFISVVSILLDSEKRFEPSLQMVGLNYKQEEVTK